MDISKMTYEEIVKIRLQDTRSVLKRLKKLKKNYGDHDSLLKLVEFGEALVKVQEIKKKLNLLLPKREKTIRKKQKKKVDQEVMASDGL